jgi:transcriptional regulator with XRE-family HTH domain
MRKSVHTPQYAALRSELRHVREAAGLSQRDLAAALGVPRSWVANVETGERRIDLIEFSWFVSACAADPVTIATRLLDVRVPRRAAVTGKRGRKS